MDHILSIPIKYHFLMHFSNILQSETAIKRKIIIQMSMIAPTKFEFYGNGPFDITSERME